MITSEFYTNKMCPICNQEFRTKIKSGNVTYCSRICFDKYRAVIKRKIACLICKKEFEKPKNQNFKNTKYCSRLCRNKSFSENRKGSGFWKNSTYEEQIQRLKILFEKKIIKTESCWDWNSQKNHRGYAQIGFNSKKIPAHRASWMIHFGNIPKDKFVLHKCDNPPCTRPDHLFLGTTQDNLNDMVIKNRNGACKKLTVEQVKEIKKLQKSKKSDLSISKLYNVNWATIRAIRINQTWKFVTTEE